MTTTNTPIPYIIMRYFRRTRRLLLCAAAAVAALGGAGMAFADPIVPTDGMVISDDTVFVPGTYMLPNGVSIGASGVHLNMNGAELVGTGFNNYGVQCLGYDTVTISNGVIRGYYYGIRAETCSGLYIVSCNLSDNWVDPDSLEAPAPFLNINVGPNLGDRVNLGGGLFLNNADNAVILQNSMSNQENGIDMFNCDYCIVASNVASNNTGWGIHLYQSTHNTITGNTADYCIRPGLGDSAGFLCVYASNDNDFTGNSFQHGGDGFFIGNEWGCPSNNNLVQGNNGSFAGANAFEATFSAGNQFIDNVADGSNYGFWLGYSHSANEIRGNSIRANNVNGIEIEHGQNNVIVENDIIGNGGKGIVLRTDSVVHFPPAQFPCLNLPNQAASSGYTIARNVIHSNFGLAMELTNTTSSEIVDNLFGGQFGGTVTSNGAGNTWSVDPTPGTNIVGGPTLGGNYWSNYTGIDTNGGQIALPGDPHPLIGDPQFEGLNNPRSLCDRVWIDLGRNTRLDGSNFDTANGAHFATDGVDLYLLEGTNSTRLSLFNPATNRYEPKAAIPGAVWDGGDLQYGGSGLYYATIGVQFDPANGGGKGSYMYVYNAASNHWQGTQRTFINGKYYANEALAYSPVDSMIYATIVNFQTGGDATSIRKLAMFSLATGLWTGLTSACPDVFSAGSEAEYLLGKIYVWRGGYAGGAVNGSDSYLNVYDVLGGTWSTTPALQDSGVIPGFRSGGFDVWGIALTADHARRQILVLGAETNKVLYVFDVDSQTWSTGPTAVYDGGWGDSMEYVAGSDSLYQIDGRSAAGEPQGTAVMIVAPGDANADGTVDLSDYPAFYDCLTGPSGPTPDGCHRMDFDCDDDVDLEDAGGFTDIFGE